MAIKITVTTMIFIFSYMWVKIVDRIKARKNEKHYKELKRRYKKWID